MAGNSICWLYVTPTGWMIIHACLWTSEHYTNSRMADLGPQWAVASGDISVVNIIYYLIFNYGISFTSLCYARTYHLFEFLAEAFWCHVHHFQCLMVLVNFKVGGQGCLPHHSFPWSKFAAKWIRTTGLRSISRRRKIALFRKKELHPTPFKGILEDYL